VHRRFQHWCEREILREILVQWANELRDRGDIDESECLIDATFASAKGGGAEIGPTRHGKGVKILAIVDRHGLPLSVGIHAANHHEVNVGATELRLLHARSEAGQLDRRQSVRQRCIGCRVEGAGVEMIAPHRSNRSSKTQDGRRLRRYQRRGLVERFFAWLQWKRRLVVR
jgi:hypothetical protein